MIENTIFIIAALIVCIILDQVLKTKILNKGWPFFVLLTALWYVPEIMAINRSWWWINPDFVSGINIGFNIPIEEFLFLPLWLFIVLIPWQYFKKYIKE